MLRSLLHCVALVCCIQSYLFSQQINADLLHGQWPSHWISMPGVSQKSYGVYHFRKTFSLDSKPAAFVIHVSADNRYRLFVNGTPVVSGPARGDLYNWYFETVDIAPYLQEGSNLIAAMVWNMAEHAPVAQITNQTGLVVQGNTEKEKVVNTDRSWKAFHNVAYTPTSLDNGSRLRTYMVIGPGDDVQAERYPWGWETNAYRDETWPTAVTITRPVVAGFGTDNYWTLMPRTIPLMEEKKQRLSVIRRSSGLEAGLTLPDGKKSVTIPPNTQASILIDQGYNTVAYPELICSGGKQAVVTMTYAEALFDKDRKKGHRDEIEGRTIIGNYDVFRPDGGLRRQFRPLWLRTFRYLQLDIVTTDDPLILNDLYGMYTGYPFSEVANFKSNDSSLQEIWDVGWRTARLCAGETYYDCPYYEQLQYEGDTRIQALISLYVSGDDRLMRKAITDFFHSRVPEGLTQGRYPSNRLQVIPPFSLYWVSMVYDYWMHRKDDEFVTRHLPAISGVLGWYEQQIDSSRQMLGPMKWWNFVDWNRAFPSGTPDGATDGNSSVISLQYVYTLRQAADLFENYGKVSEAAHFRSLASAISTGTYTACFNKAKGVMANTPAQNTFSQHASIMGVLSDAIPRQEHRDVMNRVLRDTSLSQATFYYRFYLTQALKQAGMSNLYYSSLQPWRDMLSIGLTTFAENPEPTRSDCHAWSSSPNYDFLATICGIMPAAPAFDTVLIKPSPGELTRIEGSMPHPKGTIKVSLSRRGNDGLSGYVELPANVPGRFEWGGKSIRLSGGRRSISL